MQPSIELDKNQMNGINLDSGPLLNVVERKRVVPLFGMTELEKYEWQLQQ